MKSSSELDLFTLGRTRGAVARTKRFNAVVIRFEKTHVNICLSSRKRWRHESPGRLLVRIGDANQWLERQKRALVDVLSLEFDLLVVA